jgi:regulatory protein
MRTGAPPPSVDGEPVEPDDPESVARIICLRALTARARSRAELAALLRKRGVPDEAAGTVLDRFVEVGLIDDTALATDFAQIAHGARGLSRSAVAAKLRQRGIANDVIATAVDGIDPGSERAAALHLAQRRAAAMRGLDPQAQARRLVSLLARRGSSSALSYAVAREVLADSARLEPLDLEG